MSELKIGSPVKLTGGGPGMTIISRSSPDEDGERWYCEWFVEAEGKYRGQSFPAQCLVVNVYA